MAIYVPKYNGFIADAANIDFKRCDGTIYSCNTATATSINATVNSITVTGGQSQFPIGFIDTDRGLECSFTNAQFDADMFEVANASVATDGEALTRETKKCTVDTGLIIELPFEVDTTSVYIRGLELAAESAAGKFTVAYATNKTTITFFNGDVAVGDDVYVSYDRKIANAHTIVVNTNTTTAKGELWMHWPVYSSGVDCTDAAIKGWVHIHVFRARVTAIPSIDSSYKTAATHQMTFTAMDPQRADGKMYETVYEELASA